MGDHSIDVDAIRARPRAASCTHPSSAGCGPACPSRKLASSRIAETYTHARQALMSSARPATIGTRSSATKTSACITPRSTHCPKSTSGRSGPFRSALTERASKRRRPALPDAPRLPRTRSVLVDTARKLYRASEHAGASPWPASSGCWRSTCTTPTTLRRCGWPLYAADILTVREKLPIHEAPVR